MYAFKVGDRVRLSTDVDRYPHFIAKKGDVGVVTVAYENMFVVKMDLYIEGCEEWDNEIHWCGDIDMDLDIELELE